jgi:hypothetical protein
MAHVRSHFGQEIVITVRLLTMMRPTGLSQYGHGVRSVLGTGEAILLLSKVRRLSNCV